ncbi:mediator of RNA polymerase ii transcription subunit 21 [Anaeramoeba flamelloides]|uniref:Mediator of RNA polymerase II transcription subunit 21 n=1 Tax=Anaeramoeba flamelloides TaxID=1746091 RepID=A0ABQ8X4B8_9EUKA|nr:mediator of RNA polymerase ii transcription subunit 21 [Anaeramoeba flamelloides]
MVDDLTKIQDTVDELVEKMYTAIGVIQRDAIHLKTNNSNEKELNNSIQIENNNNNSNLQTQLEEEQVFTKEDIKEHAIGIVKTSKKIDKLLDRISDLTTIGEEEQLKKLEELEKQNELVTKQLKEKAQTAEFWLKRIKVALNEVVTETHQVKELEQKLRSNH